MFKYCNINQICTVQVQCKTYYHSLENLLLFYQSVYQKGCAYITNVNTQIANIAKIIPKLLEIYRNSSRKPVNIISKNNEIKMNIL
jgi:hypothetical protein